MNGVFSSFDDLYRPFLFICHICLPFFLRSPWHQWHDESGFHSHTHRGIHPSSQLVAFTWWQACVWFSQIKSASDWSDGAWWTLAVGFTMWCTHVCVCERCACQRQTHSNSSLPRNRSFSLPTRHGWAPVTLARAAPLLIITAKLKARSLQLICLPSADSYHELGRSLAVPNGEHAYYGSLGIRPKPIIIKRWF